MAYFLHARAGTSPSTILFRLSSSNPHFDKSAHLKKFTELETNLDRVNFVYKDLQKFQLFPKHDQRNKDDTDALVAREMGNGQYRAGKYEEALRLYSESLLVAKTVEVLALAYANRSACLYKLGRYQECVTDIERALSHNYPEILKPKLIERRKLAEKMLTPLRSAQRYHEETPQFEDVEKHAYIQCAKNCVAIKTNAEFGRHVVATRDIEIGEILCIEKPYASFVTDDRTLHCHMCLEFCCNVIPCENCRYLLFCSEDCKNKANETFHKYECPIIGSLLGCGFTKFAFVALRTTLSAKEDYDQLDSTQPDEEEKYLSDRYREIHNLMAGTDKFDPEQLLQLAVIASVMYHFLKKHTDFFNTENTKTTFKEVVLRQLQIAYLNRIAVQEKTNNFCYWEQQPFALAVYAFASLFNHSCCPNIEEVHYGSTLVLRTVNTIKKNQQCFISYGLTYGKNPKIFRQAYLKEFSLFDCKCEACEKNWRLVNDADCFKYLLFTDLQMNMFQGMKMEVELASNNVDMAKCYLPYLIRQLKRCENFEPLGNALKIKYLIAKCYHVFGNKNLL